MSFGLLMVVWEDLCRSAFHCHLKPLCATLNASFLYAHRQPQGHVQILLSMLRGFSPQQAVDAPRFCISAGLADAEVAGSTAGDINSIVFFENSFDLDTVAQLKGTLFIQVTLLTENPTKHMTGITHRNGPRLSSYLWIRKVNGRKSSGD